MKQNKVQILEVGLRDGIQNEKKHFSIKDRIFMLQKMIQAGLTSIEVGSFVSHTAVPSMKLTSSFVKRINSDLKIPQSIKLSALVPNEYGFNQAVDLGIKNIAVMISATESFSQKNTKSSIQENFKRIKVICKKAQKQNIFVRGYLSMSFGCPYEGSVSLSLVHKLAQRMLDEGVQLVAISDTIGVADPLQVDRLLNQICRKISLSQISLHFHNTKGMALPNILTAFNFGVRKFDSSIGGLGGCPYAPGSSGNVATEDLVIFLKGMKAQVPIDVSQLIQISHWLKNKKKVSTSSHISKISQKKFL